MIQHKSKPFWVRVALINVQVTICVFAIYYLLRTYIMWELSNPFEWITKIPNYSKVDRAILLVSYLVYQSVVTAIVSQELKDKDAKHETQPQQK